MVSNQLDPDLMTASERLGEVTSLLARGILRYRFKAADARKKPLDVLRASSHSCVETTSEVETHE
jgi:hypothetical protein